MIWSYINDVLIQVVVVGRLFSDTIIINLLMNYLWWSLTIFSVAIVLFCFIDSDTSYESYIDASGKRQVRQKPKASKAGGRGERTRRGKDGKERKLLGKTRADFKGGFR